MTKTTRAMGQSVLRGVRRTQELDSIRVSFQALYGAMGRIEVDPGNWTGS